MRICSCTMSIPAVSYTHLDVYKRQSMGRLSAGVLLSLIHI